MNTLKIVLFTVCASLVLAVNAAEPIAVVPADRLAEILDLARSGASGLALQTLDAEQPAVSENLDEWLRWERERIAILQSRGEWQALARHLSELPDDLPTPLLRWIRTEQATALLESGATGDALTMLRDMTWSAAGQVHERELAHWRQLIVRVYLAESRLDDAQQAILKFQQDYRESSDSWAVLRARLYLRSDRAADALALIASHEDPESRNLEMLAALRAGKSPPARIMDAAIKRAVNKDNDARIRRAAWLVAAEAAQTIENHKARISALERALVDGGRGNDKLFVLDPDAVWDAYLDYGAKVGNELRLIVGNDSEWFAAADAISRSDPVQARALLAVVAFRSFNSEARAQAHRDFSQSIESQKNGGPLLVAMYLEATRFPDLSVVPPQTRYLLVEHVLQKPDIPAASRLMAGLTEPPPDTDPGDWYLRQARVLLLGGHADQGIEVLQHLLASDLAWETSRFLQVVFDLQAIERHESALHFFGLLLARQISPQEKREILFWSADSSKALGRHQQAAQLYLRSAILIDPYAMDPWAQTARYYAAEALAEAGLYSDARTIYRGLLNATKDPGRQAVLRNNIQQLMLAPQNAASDSGISEASEGSD